MCLYLAGTVFLISCEVCWGSQKILYHAVLLLVRILASHWSTEFPSTYQVVMGQCCDFSDGVHGGDYRQADILPNYKNITVFKGSMRRDAPPPSPLSQYLASDQKPSITKCSQLFWRISNRKWDYIFYFLTLYQKTSFTIYLPILPRIPKLVFISENGIIQIGNQIISSIWWPRIEKWDHILRAEDFCAKIVIV